MFFKSLSLLSYNRILTAWFTVKIMYDGDLHARTMLRTNRKSGPYPPEECLAQFAAIGTKIQPILAGWGTLVSVNGDALSARSPLLLVAPIGKHCH
jgi:hypothetical protein